MGVKGCLVSLAFILGRGNSRFWKGIRARSFCYFLNCVFTELDPWPFAVALELFEIQKSQNLIGSLPSISGYFLFNLTQGVIEKIGTERKMGIAPIYAEISI